MPLSIATETILQSLSSLAFRRLGRAFLGVSEWRPHGESNPAFKDENLMS